MDDSSFISISFTSSSTFNLNFSHFVANNLSISFGSGDMNPYYEILTIINIFKKYIKLNYDEYILKLGMFNHNYSMFINTNYKKLLKSYIKSKDYEGNMKIFKKNLSEFKKDYSRFINEKIL